MRPAFLERTTVVIPSPAALIPLEMAVILDDNEGDDVDGDEDELQLFNKERQVKNPTQVGKFLNFIFAPNFKKK